MKKNGRLPIEFIHDYKRLDYPDKKLKAIGEKIFDAEKIFPQKMVTVVLCSNYKIKKLNADYRNINKPTDVLAFPFNDSDFLGEIYISLQRCKSQAPRYGNAYEDEVARVFIHGMFHLLGFTHDTEKERIEMEKRENKYFCL
ncbi:MAG: rRNA maturation RNase YbeY [Chitinivibrionales bacterium]|nr:rRNA maturation RNase YbeY [Chitinivibrionales bacterium]